MSATLRVLSAAIFGASAIGAWPALASDLAATSAVVSVVSGPPLTLIREAAAYTASRGVVVSPGDLLQSGSGGMVVLDFRVGSAVGASVALGPSTRVGWLNRPQGTTLVLLSGWLKVDTAAAGAGLTLVTEGPRLGETSSAGVYVVHVDAERDDVFHESGAMAFWVSNGAGSADGPAVSSRPNERIVRVGAASAQTRVGPGADFVGRLPPDFLDPLPAGMSSTLRESVEPQRLRAVAYEDVDAWLAAPLDWRRGFVRRFRSRLKDPSFAQALTQRLGAHPEWQPALRAATLEVAP